MEVKHLNPNNPIVQAIDPHWHKIAALIMLKLGVTEVDITEIIESLPGTNIVSDLRNNRFVIRLVDDAEAKRLAEEAGGLPL